MQTEDPAAPILNRLSLEWLRKNLTPQEWEILWLRCVENLTFEEIGALVGLKYRDPGPEEKATYTEATIRYHYRKILAKCREYAESL